MRILEFLSLTNNTDFVRLFEKLFQQRIDDRQTNETLTEQEVCDERQETAEWVYNCLYGERCPVPIGNNRTIDVLNPQIIGTSEIIIIVICAVIFVQRVKNI